MDLDKIVMMLKSVLLMLAPNFKKADSQHGVKELTEAVDGSLALGVVLAERLKDGVGLDDLGALWDKWKNDPVIQEKLKNAVDGYEKISAEAKDLDAGEGMEVAVVAIDYAPKFVEALKKPEQEATA